MKIAQVSMKVGHFDRTYLRFLQFYIKNLQKDPLKTLCDAKRSTKTETASFRMPFLFCL